MSVLVVELSRYLLLGRTTHSKVEGSMKYVCETDCLTTEGEDSGRAEIGEVDGPGTLFVRIQSYDSLHEHIEMSHLRNKKVRITIETIED